MTLLTRKVVRETRCAFRGDTILVELHATAFFVRTKGIRHSYPIPYTDLYDMAAMREAKRKTGFLESPAAHARKFA